MMGQLGFYYNQEDCIGCRACQVACKDTNDLDVGVLFRQVKSFEVGAYPNVEGYFYSAACNHCANPACVKNCPTGAMHKSEEDGTVLHDDEVCIGCKQCVMACPYGVPQFIESKGIAGKCTSCTNLRNQYGNPPCVDACPVNALEFGDIEELKAAHANAVSDIAILPDSSETMPSVLIDKKAAADAADYFVTLM